MDEKLKVPRVGTQYLSVFLVKPLEGKSLVAVMRQIGDIPGVDGVAGHDKEPAIGHAYMKVANRR